MGYWDYRNIGASAKPENRKHIEKIFEYIGYAMEPDYAPDGDECSFNAPDVYGCEYSADNRSSGSIKDCFGRFEATDLLYLLNALFPKTIVYVHKAEGNNTSDTWENHDIVYNTENMTCYRDDSYTSYGGDGPVGNRSSKARLGLKPPKKEHVSALINISMEDENGELTTLLQDLLSKLDNGQIVYKDDDSDQRTIDEEYDIEDNVQDYGYDEEEEDGESEDDEYQEASDDDSVFKETYQLELTSVFNKEKYEGIRDVKDEPEWVSPTGAWALQIPVEFSYSMDPSCIAKTDDGDSYNLQIQFSKDQNFSDPYGSIFNLIVAPNKNEIELKDAFLDLTSEKALEAIGELIDLDTMAIFKRTPNEIVVLYRDDHKDDFHVMAFCVISKGYNMMQIVQTVTRGIKAEAARSLTFSIMRSFTGIAVTSNDQLGQYKNMNLGQQFDLHYMNNTQITVGSGIHVFIPDGYRVETNPDLIRGRAFCAAPQDYENIDNAIDATIGMSGLLDQNNWPEYDPNDCGSTLKEFKDMSRRSETPLFIVKANKKGVIAFQYWYAFGDYTWTMAKAFVWIGKELFILTIALNYSEPFANNIKTDLDAQLIIRDWLSRVVLPEQQRN